VIFLGDNGSDAPLGGEHSVASSAPLRGKKGSHYEGGVRVPFIAAWAKPDANNPAQKRLPISAGAVQTQSAAVHDLFPTILGVADAKVPEGHVVDGRKLDTLFTAKPDPTRSSQFLMHYPHGPHRSSYWTSFRDGDWKVIYHYFPSKDSEGNRYQLFNLKTDPFEQENVADKEGAVLKRMMQGLIAALELHNTVYPVEKGGGGTIAKPVLP
jgi:arylsulfatase A-like enzyme